MNILARCCIVNSLGGLEPEGGERLVGAVAVEAILSTV